MKKGIVSAVLLLAAFSAQADWRDVEYSASLPTDSVYCDGLGTFKDFASYIQDGDNAGAMRMISDGDCVMTTRAMNVQVISEDSANGFITFLSPSGKAFYTLKGYVD